MEEVSIINKEVTEEALPDDESLESVTTEMENERYAKEFFEKYNQSEDDSYKEELLDGLAKQFDLNVDDKRLLKLLLEDSIYGINDEDIVFSFNKDLSDYNFPWANIQSEKITNVLSKFHLDDGARFQDVNLEGRSLDEVILDESQSENTFKGSHTEEDSANSVESLLPGRDAAPDDVQNIKLNPNDPHLEDMLHNGVENTTETFGELLSLPFRALSDVKDKLGEWRNGQPKSSLKDAEESTISLNKSIDEFNSHASVKDALDAAEKNGDYAQISELIQRDPTVKSLWQDVNDKMGSTLSLWSKAAKANAYKGEDISEKMDEKLDEVRAKSRYIPSKFKINGQIKELMSQRISAMTDKIAQAIRNIIKKFRRKSPSASQ